MRIMNTFFIVAVILIIGTIAMGCERPENPVDPTRPPDEQESVLDPHKCRAAGGYVEHRDNPKQCRNVHTNQVISL